jgi:F-type H+-transporting ATPase subunit b
MINSAATAALSNIFAMNATPVVAAASIDIDGTIIVQMLLFWFVLGFLHFALFRPYLKAVDAREEGVEGSREEAGEMQTRAQRVIEEYEEKMRQARRDATDVRESLRNQGVQEQNDMLQEVREEIQQNLQQERGKIDAKVETARADIKQRAESLAGAMVARILPG